MANGLENLICKTRMMAGLSKARELNDRQLLEEFADGDETAFTALVDRYGGLVMGVCQRVLQHTQDAEDAFQATFMVLARKAGKIAWQDSVANWLHGVACRIAYQVRREKARHQSRSGGIVSDHATPEAAPDPSWSELKPVLDEELNRLPTRYRIPLILCCLEGKSRDEAATQLGWSLGSLKGRLERGREILRSRLAKRGLTLSAALAATLIAAAGAQAAVPLTLGLETVRAGMAMLTGQSAAVVSTQALTLAQGALHAMFMTKVKFAAAVLMTVVTLGLGTGYVTHQALAGNGVAEDRQAASLPSAQPKENHQRVNGQPDPMDDGYVPTLAEFLGQREGREERKQQPSINGVVQTVDAAKNKINILVVRGESDGQTFDLVKDVKVVLVEGRETKDAKITDVQPKTRVTLILDDAKKTVQTIQIVGTRPSDAGERGGERPGRGDGASFSGLVTEIDVVKKTISFQAGGRGDDPVTTKTFDLAKDVKVTTRTGRTIKDSNIENVPLKTVIQVKLDDTKKIVKAIEVVISTTAHGTVSEVDAKSITLTTGGRGDDVKSTTYTLSKDVKVQYWLPGSGAGRGTPGQVRSLKLADVVAKMNVTLQLNDELTAVESINLQLPHASGAIGEINAKKGTLTLKAGRGDDLNLTVAKDASIMIDGKAGTLDKVAAGTEVNLILTPDGMQVLSLQTPPAGGRRE
jgi:RNA polymerase sigma factor (sigma-70 family)